MISSLFNSNQLRVNPCHTECFTVNNYMSIKPQEDFECETQLCIVHDYKGVPCLREEILNGILVFKKIHFKSHFQSVFQQKILIPVPAHYLCLGCSVHLVCRKLIVIKNPNSYSISLKQLYDIAEIVTLSLENHQDGVYCVAVMIHTKISFSFDGVQYYSMCGNPSGTIISPNSF